MGHNTTDTLIPLNIAVLTVSDTRSEATDTAGQLLVDRLQTGGHQLADKKSLLMTSIVSERRCLNGSPTT